MDLTVRELCDATSGKLHWASMPPRDGEHLTLPRVCIDSRKIEPGDLFWALQGTQQNGIHFANDAYMRGAVGVVGDQAVEPLPGCFMLEVPESKLALWQLAAFNREHFSGVVIGVTGSVGKTTTREMIHAVLNTDVQGSRSEHNYNNEIGVPLSLLQMAPKDDYAVIEMGASRPTEIDALARLAEPQIGVITRIAPAHLEGFGNLDSIARAKAEMLALLPADGCAVVNGDDPAIGQLSETAPCDVLTFGRSSDSNIRATDVRYCDGRLRFRIAGHDFSVSVWGRHHLESALAAIAVGQAWNYSMPEISEALAHFQPVPMRCQVTRVRGITLINDAYNASPLAMKAALALMREFGTSGRRVIVTGDMLELGEAADELHYGHGHDVVKCCGADRLVACGHYAQQVAKGASHAGMPDEHIVVCSQPMDAVAPLREMLVPGDVVLAKGSRALRLERIVAALAETESLKVA